MTERFNKGAYGIDRSHFFSCRWLYCLRYTIIVVTCCHSSNYVEFGMFNEVKQLEHSVSEAPSCAEHRMIVNRTAHLHTWRRN